MIYALVFSLVVQCIDHEVYWLYFLQYNEKLHDQQKNDSERWLKKSNLVYVQVVPRLLLPLDGLLLLEVAPGTARQHKVDRNNESDDKYL